jgi:hypothetical protein
MRNKELILRMAICKCTLAQALRLCTSRTAHRGSRRVALLFHDHGTRRCEGSASRPGRSLPPGKTRYPLCRRLGGSQSRSGPVWKISPPPGFDPRTVQPVASRYTDYATRPTRTIYNRINSIKSPATPAEPRLMSHVGSMRQDQCVYATRAVEVRVFVCPFSSRSHLTGVGKP